MYMEKHPKTKHTQKYPPLHDDRLVKRPVTAYILFNSNRHASGDFHRMPLKESSALIGREWKELSAQEKKVSRGVSVIIVNRANRDYRNTKTNRTQRSSDTSRSTRLCMDTSLCRGEERRNKHCHAEALGRATSRSCQPVLTRHEPWCSDAIVLRASSPEFCCCPHS